MEIRGRFAIWAVATLLFLTGASPAAAALLHLRAYLNGAQVPTASAQTGIATLTFDTTTKLLSWSVTFTGTTGGFQLAHFHGPAAAGSDASPILDIQTTPGSSSPLVGSATLNSTHEAQLLSGQWYINIHTGSFPGGEIRGQVRRTTGDFNGDGRSDVFWRNSSGPTLVWQMNGTSISSSGSPATVSDANWKKVGVGDFDGDGKADLLWKHDLTGTVLVWLMNGSSIAGTGSPATVGAASAGWVVRAVGDFDGDGKADILWQNTLSGTLFVWRMNGTAIAGTGSPATVNDPNWVVQGAGDFNGDGKADVLWRHTNGTVFAWLMNGTSISSTGSPATVADANWVVQGIGDFDGNGKADVLWRNAPSGAVFVWLMNGAAISGTGSLPSVSAFSRWEVRGIGDYDGDGRADVLWQNAASGAALVWLMNGTAIGSTGSPGTVSDNDWQAQGNGGPSSKSFGTAALAESDAGDAFQPQIAFDPSGNALAVWVRSNGVVVEIWANRYTAATSSWGTAVPIETGAGFSFNPQIAIDANGNALAVWQRDTFTPGSHDNIWANRYTAGTGTWGTAVLIESDNTNHARNPQVAIDANGNGLAVWVQSVGPPGAIWANRYTAGPGTWGTPELIDTSGIVGTTAAPQFSFDANGNGIAVWLLGSDAVANRYTAGSGWGTVEVIGPGGNQPQIAFDANGHALAVWTFGGNVWSNRYTAGTGWGTAALIEFGGGSNARDPQIAIDANGNALAVWQDYDGTRDRIWSNRYTAGSGWGGIAAIIQTDSTGGLTAGAQTPQIAFDAYGNALAVWVQTDSNQDSTLNIWVNRYTAGIGWGTHQDLIHQIRINIPGGPGQSAGVPQIAFDANGNAFVVWTQHDGTKESIWYNRYR